MVIEDGDRKRTSEISNVEKRRRRGAKSISKIWRQRRKQLNADNTLEILAFLQNYILVVFKDVDRRLSPIDRLRIEIGDELIPLALEGFSAVSGGMIFRRLLKSRSFQPTGNIDHGGMRFLPEWIWHGKRKGGWISFQKYY